MEYYPTMLTMHIIFAGIWLVNFMAHLILKRSISQNKNKPGEKKLISLYLSFTNFLGMLGSMGILLTGMLLTTWNPGYGFFQMTANHWLVSKQIIMVVILLITFVLVIPKAKKLRAELGADAGSNSQISTEGYEYLNKLYKFGALINYLVLLNFLFAITHRFLV
jgi:hypothetical protein